MHQLILALVATHSSHARRTVVQPPDTPGCYRADRALGTSANSALGRGVPGLVGRRIGEDSASLPRLRAFRLREGGRVERPGAAGAEWWARGSRWERAGDTLRVRLSTMTSGWELRLTATPGGGDSTFVGVATYLSDAIPVDTVGSGWPPRVPVRVHRESCPPPA